MSRSANAHDARDQVFRYGAIALAAGASAVWSTGAQAALFTQVVDEPLIPKITLTIGAGFPFSDPQFIFQGSPGFSVIFPQATAAFVGFLFSGTTPKASDLAPGDVVGPSDTFLGVPDLGGGGFGFLPKTASFSGYLGLRFEVGFTGTDFGYARFVDNSLISVTYDDAGAPVTIPSVPEPGSLGLLALGAAGVGALRRRRRAEAAAA